MVADGRYAGGDERHAGVEPAGDQCLSAALAVADDGQHLAVPLRSGGEQVDRALEPEEHTAEVDRLAALAAGMAVVFQRAGAQFRVELIGFSVGDAVGVDIHGEHPGLGALDGVGEGGTADARPMHPEDCRQALGLGAFGQAEIARHRGAAEAGRLNVKALDVRIGLLDRREDRFDRHFGQLAFLVGPERIEVVGDGQAGGEFLG